MTARTEPLPDDVAAWVSETLGPDALHPDGPVVPTFQVVEFARALKERFDFLYFIYCASTHYAAEGEGDGALPDRTLVAYRVRRLPCRRLGRPTQTMPFRVWVPTGTSTPSLTGIWVGADWQEREQYDLVGTLFEGHPDLRRLMMPDDWPGHPLRRDYAIETGHFPWR